MWVDVIVLAAIGLLGAVGAVRGARESGFRLAGLLLAYVVASRVAVAAGPAAGARFGIPSWAAAALLGTLGFVGLGLLAGSLARVVGRREREAAAGLGRGSRALGGLLGAARGVLLALPLLWVADFAAGAEGLLGGQSGLPDVRGARLPALSGLLLERGGELFLDPEKPGERLAMRWVAHPGQLTRGASELLRDPRFVALQGDAGFWTAAEAGHLERALARPAFVAAARDARFRRRLAALGLIGDAAAGDPKVFRDEMAATLRVVMPRVRVLLRDPALRKMLEDPELRRRVQAGDRLALLERPELRRLMARLALAPGPEHEPRTAR